MPALLYCCDVCKHDFQREELPPEPSRPTLFQTCPTCGANLYKFKPSRSTGAKPGTFDRMSTLAMRLQKKTVLYWSLGIAVAIVVISVVVWGISGRFQSESPQGGVTIQATKPNPPAKKKSSKKTSSKNKSPHNAKVTQ